jgi:hypothetical protein
MRFGVNALVLLPEATVMVVHGDAHVVEACESTVAVVLSVSTSVIVAPVIAELGVGEVTQPVNVVLVLLLHVTV